MEKGYSPDYTPGFAYSFKVYFDLFVKAFIFFTIIGFVSMPLWKLYVASYNFFHLPLFGFLLLVSIILFLFALGFINSIYTKIFKRV